MTKIVIEVSGNDFVVNAKKKALQKIATNLEVEAIDKLAQLSNNPKAVKLFMNPPTALKIMLGI